ncbi:MAG TPA: glutathione S-transferase [Candidatus Sulfotelmatobacter sp.]|nr:glutathione S-transferase [Candidatus Sulfotelmatobacter sp.]
MKLYWSSRSPFVRKVMIAAHELGLAARIEPIPAVVALAQPNPAVMAHNPLNKIPTLIADDGSVLFDSTVICAYLDELAGAPRLFPTAPRERWAALRWHALANGLTDVLILWRSEALRPAPQRSDAVTAALALKTAATLDVLEGEADALAAAPLSIAHVGAAAVLAYLDFRFADLAWRTGRPRLAAWFAGFAQRPSMQATAFKDA